MFALNSKTQEKRLPLLELGTLLVLSVLILWSVRALLEEWGLIAAFNAQGFEYLRVFSAAIPLRPLHLLPAALFWKLSHGLPAGVPIGTLVLTLLRYAVAR